MDASDYGVLLENPRRRRRRRLHGAALAAWRRKRARGRRRYSHGAVSPRGFATPRRRRRRSRRRGHVSSVVSRATGRPVSRSTWRASGFRRNPRRRRYHRRNPAFLGKLGLGNLGGTFMRAGGLFGAELLGDLAVRALGRFTPLGKIGKTPATRQGIGRILVGTVGTMVLNKLPFVPQVVKNQFGAINIASGLIALTYPMREKLLQDTLKLPQLSGLSESEDDGVSEMQRGLLEDFETVEGLSAVPAAGLLEDFETVSGMTDEEGPMAARYQ